MSEIDFLIELIFEHKLGRTTKDRIRERLKEVQFEKSISNRNFVPFTYNPGPTALPNPTGVPQSPSTLKALARQADGSVFTTEPVPEPEPVKVIAQTPETMAAMAARAQSIANAGKPDPATGRPRKF